jgi:hypothetical protein
VDSIRTRVPLDTWIWGPDDRSIYGQRGENLVRATYSTGRGFEVGEVETLFPVGQCPWGSRNCEIHVGDHRILTIGHAGGMKTQDYSVIIWHQGFADVKNHRD